MEKKTTKKTTKKTPKKKPSIKISHTPPMPKRDTVLEKMAKKIIRNKTAKLQRRIAGVRRTVETVIPFSSQVAVAKKRLGRIATKTPLHRQRGSSETARHRKYSRTALPETLKSALSKAWKTRKLRYGPSGRRKGPSVKARLRRQSKRYGVATTQSKKFRSTLGGASRKSFYEYQKGIRKV